MVSLYLLRHAKAAPAAPGMRDFDRPLDARGIRDARLVGKALAAKGVSPQNILCSSSRRTRQTLDEILPVLPFPGHVHYSDSLYSGDAEFYLREIRAFAHSPSLLVIGHNPSMQDLAIHLAPNDDRKAARLLMEGFPTGALAHFHAEGGLAHIKLHSCPLIDFLRPKDL